MYNKWKTRRKYRISGFNNVLDVRRFVTLIILDGFVYFLMQREMVWAAKLLLDTMWTHGRSTIHAAGTHVGLPGEDAGNSEVGHLI